MPRRTRGWVGPTGIEWGFRWSTDPQNLEQMLALAQRAQALDDAQPDAHQILSAQLALAVTDRGPVDHASTDYARSRRNTDTYTVRRHYAGTGKRV